LASVKNRVRTASTAFGFWLLVLYLVGCAERAAMAPAATAQQECERTGGAWRNERCESSGGGY
jgi:hypothetical protein